MFKHNALLKQLCESVSCAPNGHVISMTGAVLATFTSPTPPPGMPDIEPIVSSEPILVRPCHHDPVIDGASDEMPFGLSWNQQKKIAPELNTAGDTACPKGTTHPGIPRSTIAHCCTALHACTSIRKAPAVCGGLALLICFRYVGGPWCHNTGRPYSGLSRDCAGVRLRRSSRLGIPCSTIDTNQKIAVQPHRVFSQECSIEVCHACQRIVAVVPLT